MWSVLEVRWVTSSFLIGRRAGHIRLAGNIIIKVLFKLFFYITYNTIVRCLLLQYTTILNTICSAQFEISSNK